MKEKQLLSRRDKFICLGGLLGSQTVCTQEVIMNTVLYTDELNEHRRLKSSVPIVKYGEKICKKLTKRTIKCIMSAKIADEVNYHRIEFYKDFETLKKEIKEKQNETDSKK